MLLSVERPNRGSLCLLMTKGHAVALYGLVQAVLPASVWNMADGLLRFPRNLGESYFFLLLGNSRLEIPGYQLQALAAALVRQGANERVHPRYRQAKETKCGEMAVGRRNALIVPKKLGNSPRRTQWRKAKRRPTESIEGNMLNTSRFFKHVNVSRSNSFGDHVDGEAVGRGTGCSNAGTSGSVGALVGNRQGHPARRTITPWPSICRTPPGHHPIAHTRST